MMKVVFVIVSLLALGLGPVWAAEEGEQATVLATAESTDSANANANVDVNVAAAVGTEAARADASAAAAAAESMAVIASADAEAAALAEAEADAEAEIKADAEAELDAEASGAKRRPINCMDAKVRGIANKAGGTGSGVYWVKPLDGQAGFFIWCDMDTDGGGWNVLQKRFDGSVDFYRPWVDYKKGFGSVKGEYWLGLDRIHRMSKTMPHMLRITMESFDGLRKYGTWRTFMVDDEAHKYTLTARGFRDYGIGNSLRYHSGRPFSTYDRDNDAWANNCSSYFHGAWWYGACHNSNMNGRYYRYPGKHPRNYADGADWLTFKGHFESVKRVIMMFK